MVVIKKCVDIFVSMEMGWLVVRTLRTVGVVVCVLGLIATECRGSSSDESEGSDCFVKWVHGYRLASGRPQKILHSVSLEICKQECASTPGCAAFAYR